MSTEKKSNKRRASSKKGQKSKKSKTAPDQDKKEEVKAGPSLKSTFIDAIFEYQLGDPAYINEAAIKQALHTLVDKFLASPAFVTLLIKMSKTQKHGGEEPEISDEDCVYLLTQDITKVLFVLEAEHQKYAIHEESSAIGDMRSHISADVIEFVRQVTEQAQKSLIDKV